MTLSNTQRNNALHYAECGNLFIDKLSAIILNAAVLIVMALICQWLVCYAWSNVS
jgi:hypothetical protein